MEIKQELHNEPNKKKWHTHSEKKNTPPQSRQRRPVIAFYIGQKQFG